MRPYTAVNGGAVLLDVRSPGEFEKGHVPGAVSVPLFSDDERAAVGTAFAKQGRGPAMVMVRAEEEVQTTTTPA